VLFVIRFLKLVFCDFSWKGSIYKIIWKQLSRQLLIYYSLYYTITILHNFVLDEDGKTWVNYFICKCFIIYRTVSNLGRILSYIFDSRPKSQWRRCNTKHFPISLEHRFHVKNWPWSCLTNNTFDCAIIHASPYVLILYNFQSIWDAGEVLQ
jgi:hypothetical protein